MVRGRSPPKTHAVRGTDTVAKMTKVTTMKPKLRTNIDTFVPRVPWMTCTFELSALTIK